MNRSSWTAAGAAAAVVGIRVLAEWYAHSMVTSSPMRILGLAVVGVALGHAFWMASRAARKPDDVAAAPGPAIWWLWVGVLLLAIGLWPAAFSPNKYSLAALVFFGSILIWPAAIAESWPTEGPVLRWVWVWRQVLVASAVAVAVASTAVYLQAARASIGSVDFFYYICTARDMLAHSTEVSDNCYCYFPGVYAFWRSAMRVMGNSLAQLQLSYLIVVIVNAGLLSALVWQVVKRPLVVLLAPLWYLVLNQRR